MGEGDPLCTWHSVFQITNAIRAPATLQLRPFPSLSRKKNGLSIFITEIAVCHSQGASVPLSLPSAGGGVAKNSRRGGTAPRRTLKIEREALA